MSVPRNYLLLKFSAQTCPALSYFSKYPCWINTASNILNNPAWDKHFWFKKKLIKATIQCERCWRFSKQTKTRSATLSMQRPSRLHVYIDYVVTHHVSCLRDSFKRVHSSFDFILPKQNFYTSWIIFNTILAKLHSGVSYDLCVHQSKAYISTKFTILSSILGCFIIAIVGEIQCPHFSKMHHNLLQNLVLKPVTDFQTNILSIMVDYANIEVSRTITPK